MKKNPKENVISRVNGNSYVRNLLSIGYDHYSRESERKSLQEILLGKRELPALRDDNLITLAQSEIRAIKNGMIVTVALLCRTAADLGANDIRCYALSDYYISKIEEIESKIDYDNLMQRIIGHYRDLVQENRYTNYSAVTNKAIRYIQSHLYEKCTLQQIARAISLSPEYLSAVFRRETGLTVTEFTLGEKINEAASILELGELTVTQVSDLMGFCNTSYFCRVFKARKGETPSAFRRNGLKMDE